MQNPTHSRNLAPLDLHFFGPLKWHLVGQWFVNDDDVIVAVKTCLLVHDQDFFAKGFNALVSSQDKCLNSGGDYIEK
jgi:hypothetical protein